MPIKAVVSLSGGLDSTVLLNYLMQRDGIRPDELLVVSFDYGSKHGRYELEAAEKVRQWFSIPLLNRRVIDLELLRHIADKSSALMKSGGPIPEGHYNHDSMKATVVPGRNLMFISILASIAEIESRKNGLEHPPVMVAVGIHQGDHFIYPDCRPTFANAASNAVYKSTDGRVVLNTPFLGKSKEDIVREGLRLGSPVHLTRTCYKDQPVACGKCGSCVERQEAFQLNGTADPIEYAKEETP